MGWAFWQAWKQKSYGKFVSLVTGQGPTRRRQGRREYFGIWRLQTDERQMKNNYGCLERVGSFKSVIRTCQVTRQRDGKGDLVLKEVAFMCFFKTKQKHPARRLRWSVRPRPTISYQTFCKGSWNLIWKFHENLRSLNFVQKGAFCSGFLSTAEREGICTSI